LLICTLTVPRNLRRGRMAGPSVAAALWVIGGATDRRLVGTVVTAVAENSLPATRIDPFPEPAW
jgi:hypothetical protein